MAFSPTCGLVRMVPSTFSRAIVMDTAGERPKVEAATRQHQEYVAHLRAAGVAIRVLESGGPDSCFVEDQALIFGGVAILLRVGHPQRRDEGELVHQALREVMPTLSLPEGTVDGGDVLSVRQTLFVGRSSRTNELGIRTLRALVEPLGAEVVEVPVEFAGVLHLKSAASFLDETTVLVAEQTLDRRVFERHANVVVVPREENYAANTLTIGSRTLVPAGYPRTASKIEALGFEPVVLPMSEFQKADGALTCLSLLW